MATSAGIKPYKVSVPDAAIKLLKDKLAVTTWPDETEFSDDWAYGSPLSDVKRLAKYWADGFDWRKQEAKMNEMPQFETKIPVDGFGELNIHFVHKPSPRPGAIPLCFSHGWPGSFLEIEKILPLLTEPEEGQAFHVVAPSLPNFGFSDRVSKPGFSPVQHAETLHKLMLKLGYNQYVNQGGDWGFIIVRLMAAKYPEHCLATHINFARVLKEPSALKAPLQFAQDKLQGYTDQERAGLERSEWFDKEGKGYNLLQSTKPSTLGFALRDSPVALLAWIYEKLVTWTDSYPWTDDEVLTWISVYQFSVAGPQHSSYIYYENTHAHQDVILGAAAHVPNVPMGYSIFPQDLVVPPTSWARTLGNIVFERRHADGGHFASHERPQKLAEDLREMFRAGGKLDDIVKKFI
ncbi:microsomal epoxide hydrolase [Paramyrothecium foliicola]|nr:microsomal epoxide hydrolase [Paramyrothecium foliicola]